MSHDPFSPDSAAAPPSADVAPNGHVAQQDLSVLQPNEPSPATETPQTGAKQETTNDAPTPAPDAQAPAQAPQEPAQPQLEVKVGTSKEVLDWVNEAEGDERTVRAQAALDAERASSEPRKGLSHELEELLGGSN